MSNRLYRFLVGLAILIALYFDQTYVIWGMIAMMAFESLSGLQLPIAVSRFRGIAAPPIDEGSLGLVFKERFRFSAERAWRLTVAIVLLLTYVVFPSQAWFFPWFIAFTLIGAGLSGVCPVLLLGKWIGFR